MFLPHVHRFRAIAILVIVSGHVFENLDWTGWGLSFQVLDKLLSNGSVLFVFIGGYLFEHLSRDYRYGDYLLRKLRIVVLPYLVCAMPAVLYSAALNPPFDVYPFLADWPVLRRALWMYLVGGGHPLAPMWFIPMIVLFYLAAPIYIQFVRHPRLYWLLPALVPMAMLAHRPGTAAFFSGYALENAVYFAPVYLLGMWTSAQRGTIEPATRRLLPALLIAFGLYMALEVLVQQHLGDYEGSHLFSQEHGLLDWTLGQKLILCYLLLGLTQTGERALAAPLSYIGAASFTIYFLHYYVVLLFLNRHDWIRPPADLLTGALLVAIAVAACCLISVLGRRLLGGRSRYLLGS